MGSERSFCPRRPAQRRVLLRCAKWTYAVEQHPHLEVERVRSRWGYAQEGDPLANLCGARLGPRAAGGGVAGGAAIRLVVAELVDAAGSYPGPAAGSVGRHSRRRRGEGWWQGAVRRVDCLSPR